MTINWLLLFVPIAVVLEHAALERALWIFLAAAVAIMPLAGWMGQATEHLAERTGEGVGGLLNATFGNAAELIIAIAAMRSGLLLSRETLAVPTRDPPSLGRASHLSIVKKKGGENHARRDHRRIGEAVAGESLGGHEKG